TKTKILGTTDFLWNVTYYDDRYRPIQVISQNSKGGIDRVTTVYDFPGKILERKTTHNSSAVTQLAMKERMEYDHAGRTMKVHHVISDPSNKVVWIDKSGVTQEEGHLVKTGTVDAYDAGARTKNYLEASEDGWFEIPVESNYRVLMGFADDDPDADYHSID